MKSWIRNFLVLTLALCLAAGSAMATEDTPEAVGAKLSHFYDALVSEGIGVTVSAFDASTKTDELDGEVTTYYNLADYIMVVTVQDDEYSFSYQLFLLQADIPEDANADTLYALFLSACADDEVSYEDAAGFVAWLREYMVQTGVYSITASRAFGPFTATLSGSLTDSEECISLTRYSGVR